MASMEVAKIERSTDRDPNRPLRIVMISTPRAGNNWLRHLLIGLYGIPSIPVHDPREVDWAALPSECLLAIHWHPTPAFLERLSQHRFQSIVLARHPLDVLISILHFALHYSSSQATQRWLEGEDGNERCIFAAMPRSTAFLDYATGRRAAALLSVSHEWWRLPGSVQVRYEDLLQDTEGTLQGLAQTLGAPIRLPLGKAVAANDVAGLRESTGSKYHFWRGQSGLWRSLLPGAEARLIAHAHPAVFANLGYGVEPDPALDAAQADANWIKLIWDELAEDLFALHQRSQTAGALSTMQAQLAESQAQLVESRRAKAELVERFTAVQNQLLATQVTYQDMLAKFTLAHETVGEMRARCALAERQAEELRQEHVALQARQIHTQETCDVLREQVLLLNSSRGRVTGKLRHLARWLSDRRRAS